jgi:hypothetical protein
MGIGSNNIEHSPYTIRIFVDIMAPNHWKLNTGWGKLGYQVSFERPDFAMKLLKIQSF